MASNPAIKEAVVKIISIIIYENQNFLNLNSPKKVKIKYFIFRIIKNLFNNFKIFFILKKKIKNK